MNAEDYIPLFDAIRGGDLATVESFLQTPGVDVDSVVQNVYDDEDIYTPLIRAIDCNQKSIVEVLLDHGAAVNGVDGAGKTPLQQACYLENANKYIINVLLEHGADIEAFIGRFRLTPLTLACNSNTNVGIVQLLLNAGADVNGNHSIIAPLHAAIRRGRSALLEMLIEAGADVNIQSTGLFNLPAGSTPLHGAADVSRIQFVATLLAAGADPNIANSEGRTPLHHAVWYSVDVVNALQAGGGDPLHQAYGGRTPLQHLYHRFNMNFSARHFNITALVAAGDRSWECVPTPCPGLEAAMVYVWQAAPEELPELSSV